MRLSGSVAFAVFWRSDFDNHFHESRGYPLAGSVSLSVFDQGGAIRVDVGLKFAGIIEKVRERDLRNFGDFSHLSLAIPDLPVNCIETRIPEALANKTDRNDVRRIAQMMGQPVPSGAREGSNEPELSDVPDGVQAA